MSNSDTLADASALLRTTLAVEEYRARLVALFNFIDEISLGKIDIPLDPKQISKLIDGCIDYVLEGESSFHEAREMLSQHEKQYALLQQLKSKNNETRLLIQQEVKRLCENSFSKYTLIESARKHVQVLDSNSSSTETEIDVISNKYRKLREEAEALKLQLKSEPEVAEEKLKSVLSSRMQAAAGLFHRGTASTDDMIDFQPYSSSLQDMEMSQDIQGEDNTDLMGNSVANGGLSTSLPSISALPPQVIQLLLQHLPPGWTPGDPLPPNLPNILDLLKQV
jgi:hypothetical protein